MLELTEALKKAKGVDLGVSEREMAAKMADAQKLVRLKVLGYPTWHPTSPSQAKTSERRWSPSVVSVKEPTLFKALCLSPLIAMYGDAFLGCEDRDPSAAEQCLPDSSPTQDAQKVDVSAWSEGDSSATALPDAGKSDTKEEVHPQYKDMDSEVAHLTIQLDQANIQITAPEGGILSLKHKGG